MKSKDINALIDESLIYRAFTLARVQFHNTILEPNTSLLYKPSIKPNLTVLAQNPQ